jgi:hypothetical protein
MPPSLQFSPDDNPNPHRTKPSRLHHPTVHRPPKSLPTSLPSRTICLSLPPLFLHSRQSRPRPILFQPLRTTVNRAPYPPPTSPPQPPPLPHSRHSSLLNPKPPLRLTIPSLPLPLQSIRHLPPRQIEDNLELQPFSRVVLLEPPLLPSLQLRLYNESAPLTPLQLDLPLPNDSSRAPSHLDLHHQQRLIPQSNPLGSP